MMNYEESLLVLAAYPRDTFLGHPQSHIRQRALNVVIEAAEKIVKREISLAGIKPSQGSE